MLSDIQKSSENYVCCVVMLILSKVKDYIQTSENGLSSAGTWTINNIRCSQKTHRLLEMLKIDSIITISCLPRGIMTYLRGS